MKNMTATDYTSGETVRLLLSAGGSATSAACAARWDAMAQDFELQYSRSDYRHRMMERIEVTAATTVLDVGCGPGTLALPLARRAATVTALDISKRMLEVGEARAAEEHIANISFVQIDWAQAVIGDHVPTHDVVVCSRTFIGPDPLRWLAKLDRAANLRVYLTLRTADDEARRFFEALYARLGMEYRPHPDYMTYCETLQQLGIAPEVAFVEYTDCFRYESETDAFRVLNGHIGASEAHQQSALMSFIRANMAANGSFKLDIESRLALISWSKNETS